MRTSIWAAFLCVAGSATLALAAQDDEDKPPPVPAGWLTSVEEAKQQALAEGRPIFAVFR